MIALFDIFSHYTEKINLINNLFLLIMYERAHISREKVGNFKLVELTFSWSIDLNCFLFGAGKDAYQPRSVRMMRLN